MAREPTDEEKRIAYEVADNILVNFDGAQQDPDWEPDPLLRDLAASLVCESLANHRVRLVEKPLHEALESVRLNHLHETRILYQQANEWKHSVRAMQERLDALEADVEALKKRKPGKPLEPQRFK